MCQAKVVSPCWLALGLLQTCDTIRITLSYMCIP